MDTKRKLRREFSARRSAAKSELKDGLITARLMSLDRILNADLILLYASFGSEVNTWSLADRLMKRGISVAFPKCGDDGIMQFHCVTALGELSDGKYGICEPDSSLPVPQVSGSTVCIIPGLAFTENGCRLGYGGGYYDRYLSEHPEIYKIALAYENTIADELPQEEYDIKINAIVTEERLVLCDV